MTFTCKFCESTEYNIIDGFYYCNDCHRQNEQEFEFDAFGLGADGVLKKTKIQDVTAGSLKNIADKKELTSWESFNYILHGLVEELIQIGVKPEVKLTVFQLWTHYLRKTEVAFFNKKNPTLPKLPPIFKKRDADILYNHQRRARKRKRSESSDRTETSTPTTNRARLLKISRLMDKTTRSEYESELEESKTDINRTLTSLADVSAAEIRTVSGGSTYGTGSNVSSLVIEFSTYARSVFKKIVPKKHISKHTNDFKGDLKCHVINYNDLGPQKFKLLTRRTLLGIIYCALNYHKEPIQIGDLIRFCREGHLSHNDAKKFLPRNLSEKEIDDLHVKYTRHRQSEVICHTGFRMLISRVKEILDVELEIPDLCALSQRYVEELTLPSDISKFVERIIVLCPPEMNYGHHVPSHEARAMACVIFILKLLMGLDDVTEMEISDAAQDINGHLERCESKSRLFVWREWMEFIEARKSLIQKYHAPSFLRTTRQNTESYLHHTYKNTFQPEEVSSLDDEKRPKFHTKQIQQEESMTQFAKYISEADANRDPKETDFNFIAFPASLTPSKTYMEIIRDDYADKVSIPSILLTDHSKHDIYSFLEPLNLYKEFLRKKIRLELETASINPDIKFKRWNIKTCEELFEHFDETNFNITANQWKEKLKKDTSKYEAHLSKDEHEVHIRRHTKFLRRKGRTLSECKIAPDNDSSLFDPEACLEKALPIPDSSQFDSTVTLKVPHFHYWSHFYYSSYGLTSADSSMFDEISEYLPKNFFWLLNHCANMIEITPHELYIQLLIVENQFLFALKPMNRMKRRVRYRTKNQLPRRMAEYINFLKTLW